MTVDGEPKSESLQSRPEYVLNMLMPKLLWCSPQLDILAKTVQNLPLFHVFVAVPVVVFEVLCSLVVFFLRDLRDTS